MFGRTIRTAFMTLAAVALTSTLALAQSETSKPFSGAKVNAGTVTIMTTDGRRTLTLSDDFKVPDTPDPHWQVVDSKGRVFLLQRLAAKNALGIGKDRINMSIALPTYIEDVAKVQIYCAWAEAVLGETTLTPSRSRATN